MKIAAEIFHKDTVRQNGDSLLLWACFAVLSTYVIEGPLRYVFGLAGQPSLIYLRDAVVVVSIAFVFCRSLLLQNWLEPAISIAALVLLFHLAVGLLLGLQVFQVFFAFKIFISILLGIALYPLMYRRIDVLFSLLGLFFAITVSGVVLNYALEKFPWEGVNYETAFGKVSGTVEWWTNGGVRRLPGFARSSFDAAMIIGITGFACLLKYRRVWLRLLIIAAAFSAIILTTTKGMAQAFLVLSIWIQFQNHRNFLPLGRFFVVVLLIVAVVLPSVVVFFEMGQVYKAEELPKPLSSLWDRFSWMWPNAFDLFSGPENYLFGGGLGSIGTPQDYGLEPERGNAADNIFVYLFINFGPLALLYLVFPAWRLVRSEDTGNIMVWSLGMLIICYGYGITTNMLEQPFFSIFLGMVLGYALHPQALRQSHALS